MQNLEINTRVSVTEKHGKKFTTWFGIIKKIHDNVNPPKKEMKETAGYSIQPDGQGFSILKVRHHTFVKKA